MLAVEEHQTTSVVEGKYCHVVCGCNTTLTFCGAYKPKLCDIFYLDTIGYDKCPVCKKPYCELCEGLITHECPYCGE